MPISGTFCDMVSRLHCCAVTGDSIANKGVLTAQAFLVPEASLSRQQNFGTARAKACWLHTVLLLKLDTTVCQLSRLATNVDQQNVSVPMSFAPSTAAKSRLFLPCFVCLYTAVGFTDVVLSSSPPCAVDLLCLDGQ